MPIQHDSLLDIQTVDAVLLIDADNDPHLPPDFTLGPRTLVRVFLRTGAKPPRALERRLEGIPMCVTVVSPQGGGNAADFVMSLHSGILHATLPMHVPFTLVTADVSLSVMAQELQRLGRRAALWTSHDKKPVSRRPAKPAKPPARRPATRTKPAGRTLAQAAAAYAARMKAAKTPPTRLTALLNDIKNRAAKEFTPEQILEQLKQRHGLRVDANGRVSRKT
ncbi:MAG: hypothetical protein ABIJ96_17620 [Elusimicrobiota bacterium]